MKSSGLSHSQPSMPILCTIINDLNSRIGYYTDNGLGNMEPNESRIRIMNFLRFTGPSLPINTSKGCSMSTLIVSAFLAEMSENKQIKISYLKYGGSPLYYLPGQEALLENFISHLNSYDREIFQKLKENGVLEDLKQEPVHRVGLRNIKDFAFPIRVVHNGQEKLFWRIYSFTDQQAFEKIKEILEKPEIKKLEIKQEIKEQLQVKQLEEISKEIKKIAEAKPVIEAEKPKALKKPRQERKKQAKEEKKIIEEKKEENPEIARAEVKKPKVRAKKIDIKTWMAENKINIINEVLNKPKESIFLIATTSNLGELQFYSVFKDKKSISESDIVMAYQLSQDAKLPLFFITSGKLTKKAQEHAINLKVLLKQI